MQGHRYSKESPLLLHVVNVAALLLAGLLLLLTAVARAYQLALLGPVLVLLVVYWRFRTNPRVAAGCFGFSVGLVGWILVCEHIVTIDNVFGTQISKRLTLGLRLQSYVADTLHTPDRLYLEPCCHDPLTWHYRPGSTYRKTFDCETCGEPYELVVDETGYLNEPPGLMQRPEPIDLFLAGDSLLQGYGVPNVLTWLRAQLPLRMWNLSMAGYSARQKVNALLTYALPKRPRWLIVEFYGGNDLWDEVRNEACDGGGDFRCRSNMPAVHRQLAHHPVYRTVFRHPTGVLARFAELATENLTLATTRYLIDTMKGAFKERLMAKGDRSSATGDAAHKFYNTNVDEPAAAFSLVREGQWPVYLNTSMQTIQKHYERLWGHLENIHPKPTVILLYNPTPYEVYRGMWIDPHPEEDQASAFQRDALREFAHAYGWRYLDLTDPLRQEVRARQVWLYGQHDKSHWSPQGTALVAAVLSRGLLEVIARETPPAKRVPGASHGSSRAEGRIVERGEANGTYTSAPITRSQWTEALCHDNRDLTP
jgi:GDSL-like Lipase/Acylhydrolase family